jgi:putative effector of murein hydrolase
MSCRQIEAVSGSGMNVAKWLGRGSQVAASVLLASLAMPAIAVEMSIHAEFRPDPLHSRT